MAKTGRYLFVLCLVATVAGLASQAQAMVTQLGILLDGSGSISGGEFTTAKNGIADAIDSQVPVNSTVEITAVQFGDNAVTFVTPTLIDSVATRTTVSDAFRNLVQDTGFTNMGGGIIEATSQITGSPQFGQTGNRSIFNLVTDGEPTIGPDTLTAANDAITAGIDAMSAEAIGSFVDIPFLQSIVFPNRPGVIAPPFPNPFTQGFVLPVASFDDLPDAFEAKLGIIVDPTNGVPEPVTAVLGLMGLGTLSLATRRRLAA